MGFEDAAATGVVGLDAGDAEAGGDGDALRGGVGLQGGVAVEQIHLAEAHADGIADNDGSALCLSIRIKDRTERTHLFDDFADKGNSN